MPAPKPEGWHTITPRLVVADPAAFVEFLKRAFGATGDFVGDMPAQMRLGDSVVMVSAVGPREATASFLYLYVDDVDAVYRDALAAGAKPVEEPGGTPYGDRRAMIADPFGNDWQIATYGGAAKHLAK